MPNQSPQYQQTLQWLFQQLPMYQRQGAVAFKKDLNNIQALCQYLDQPQTKFSSIHIAGTNGKGSTAHLLACLFQQRGFKTGLYTSPHYSDFRERIKINGDYISPSKVIQFVDNHQEFFRKLEPSFFEITVALAFDYFAKEQVDIAIIETGLGGRLDSTNIIEPILSVITNISFDHQEMLGNTLQKIAAEKAGIIKRDTPVVIGETQPKIKSVFAKKAQSMNAPIFFADEQFEARETSHSNDHTFYDIYRKEKLCYPKLKVQLLGPFQSKNIATSLQAVECFNSLSQSRLIREYDIRNGWPKLQKHTRFKGRWQVIGQRPTIICDSAHNESGLQGAMQALQDKPFRKLHMVVGMVRDKNVDKLLACMPPEAQYYFCKAAIPRGMEVATLAGKAAKFGLKGEEYTSVGAAFEAARSAADVRDLIFVGGSTFVVAEVVE